MLAICSICLRSDRKLSAHDKLENFYEELCEYANCANPKFCSECIYKLIKYYEFKKSCNLANAKLKKWKKQKKDGRKPINLLHTELPPPQLSLSNKNNFKVYFYQSADLEIAAPIEVSSSGQPNTVTLNIPRYDNNALPSSSVVENDEKVTESTIIIKQETNEMMEFTDNDNQASEIINLSTVKVDYDNIVNDIKTDNDNHILEMIDTVNIEHDYSKPSKKESEELGSDDDLTDSDDEFINNREEIITSDSDESLKELKDFLAKIKKPKTLLEMTNIDINDTGKKDKYKKKALNVEALKTHLKEKFERYGDIKDDKGNVINKDIVINNLDRVYCLPRLKKLCSGPGPFNALAISKLSEIHSRFVYDSMFDIVVLKNEEQMQAEFEKRRLITDPSRPYRCERCLVSFKYRLSLDSHNKRNHNEAYAFECPICHVRFRNEKMVRNHNSSHHRATYKCKMCTKFITCLRACMIDHYINIHRGVKRTCEYCGKCFSKSGLALHINTAHEPQHICELCACAFMKPRGLEIHKNLKHVDEKFIESEHNTKCETCNVTFITEDVYLKHMKITHNVHNECVHNEEDRCTKRRGKRQNTKKPTYSCRLCEWKGSTRVMQTEHYKTEHPHAEEELQSTWKHLCHECGKRFKHLHEHRAHMNKHTGKRPYACKICPKKFFSHIALDVHTQRHLPPSFECPYCEKKFTTSTGLNTHKRIHINDKRHKCPICGKGFLFSGNMKQHIDGVHFNVKRIRKERQQDDMDSE